MWRRRTGDRRQRRRTRTAQGRGNDIAILPSTTSAPLSGDAEWTSSCFRVRRRRRARGRGRNQQRERVPFPVPRHWPVRDKSADRHRHVALGGRRLSAGRRLVTMPTAGLPSTETETRRAKPFRREQVAATPAARTESRRLLCASSSCGFFFRLVSTSAETRSASVTSGWRVTSIPLSSSLAATVAAPVRPGLVPTSLSQSTSESRWQRVRHTAISGRSPAACALAGRPWRSSYAHERCDRRAPPEVTRRGGPGGSAPNAATAARREVAGPRTRYPGGASGPQLGLTHLVARHQPIPK